MKDVADYADEKGPIQHILISGDIANTGAKSEYEKATEFIKELCRKCKCPDHEVYVVPGNHDKNFNEKGSGVRHLIHEGITIDEMRACLKPLGYSDTINEAAINFILREFVMSKVSCDEMNNMDMIVELLRPQLEVPKEYNNITHLNIFLQTSDILPGLGSYQGLS